MPQFDVGGEVLDLPFGGHEVAQGVDGVVVRINAPGGTRITFDGLAVPSVPSGDREVAAIVLPTEPAMGAHRLELRSDSAPCRLDVITPIIELTRSRLVPATEIVRSHLPRSRGTFWYRTGDGTPSKYSDALTSSVFVSDAEHLIRAALHRVRATPVSRRSTRPHTQPFAGAMRVNETLQLMAKHPQLLGRRADGRLRPALVVEGVPVRTSATPENQQLVAFLRRLMTDTQPASMKAAGVGLLLGDATQRVRATIGAALQSAPLVGLQPMSLRGPSDPSCGREDDLPGYRELALLRREYVQLTAPSPKDTYHREFLPSPDDIYEAYVAEMIAAAFEMSPVGRGLRDRSNGPSFQSDDWELWFDLSTSVQSWRRNTNRPDRYRPDVVLKDRHDESRVVVVDAKYSFRTPSEDGTGRGAPGARLKEVQSYLNAFGLGSVVVIHPGTSAPSTLWVEDIAAHGYLIRQVELNAAEPASLGPLLRALRLTLEASATVAGTNFLEVA